MYRKPIDCKERRGNKDGRTEHGAVMGRGFVRIPKSALLSPTNNFKIKKGVPMIQTHSKTASNTISYLNDMYPTERELYIHILDGYDTVEVNNNIGFGVSHIPDNENENYEIWVAGDLPDEYLITTIAHEFAHFLQYIHGEPFDEDEAEEFANKVLEELQCQQKE